ncbi:DUF2207 domain-containing protein [Sphingomonas sp.]|uniref:DUF2207 domain-containing protein n=1 Tax=Sphingomonas sp. TaxID=28214 RepID=UPI00286DD8CC|nr:DUF2207 domain-containing protein [Sphingomonas sp.]
MLRLIACLAALLACAVPAAAEERITRFVSDVEIKPDASLEVTETIDVVAENVRINRGIYRDFPTRYRGRRGNPVRVDFTLLGAQRDGYPEMATTEAIANGIRIKLGNPDKMIDQGEHRYVIRYRTTRQIGRFKDFDELYWNVTGNGWVFPINNAEARIRLPSPVAFGQRAFYTGPQGSTAANAEVSDEKLGEISFRTIAPLGPNEGLTVAVAWPKGVVAEADPASRAKWWIADYGPLIVGALGLIGVLIFYYIAWQRAGRNPRAGPVVPLFSPPDGLTPAAMRYVWKMGADNRAFAAALVDLGVRGHVRLVEEEGGFFKGDQMRLERLAAATPLPEAEEAMLREIATSGESIVMEQKNHAKFGAAQKALREAFAKGYEGKLFNRNWGWAFAGFAVMLSALWLASAAVAAATGSARPLPIMVGLGASLTTLLLLLLIRDSKAAGKCLLVGAALLFAALSVSTGLPVFFSALSSGWWMPLLIPALALPLAISAFWWIAAPTREGRGVLDRIAGFRHYLSITEGERIDRMTAPKDTPELFEKYLPYAIALGVENRWADRFSGVLAAAAAQGSQGFAWYSGSHNAWDNPGGFVDSVGASLASTVSAASTAPGSSSGSGGGGSSGGGGGGGGGGGW